MIRFKTIKIGMPILIEGAVDYVQDMKRRNGSFTGITFKLDDIGESRIRLTAPGYGGEPYGSGAIYVGRDQFNKIYAVID